MRGRRVEHHTRSERQDGRADDRRALAAEGDLTGNWSWTVWLLIPLVLVLAYVTARVVGPHGEPPPDRVERPGRQRAPRPGAKRRRIPDDPSDPRRCCSPSAVLAADRVRPEGRRRRQRRRRGGADDRAACTDDRGAGPTDPRRRRRPGSTEPPAVTGAATTAGAERRRPSTAAPTTAAPDAGPFEPGPNDTAGVTDDEIVIGIHAPVTGASPIPQESFDVGKDIYWKFLAASAPDRLFGRNVRVVFRDDEFNPQNAVQVCREMVEQEGAFLLVGGGGADQITACAQYANENGIPYLSAGVNETGLTDLATYFATSLTYAEQAPMIVAQLQDQGFTEAALVVADTPSFDDAEAAHRGGRRRGRAGASRSTTRINKDASPAESATVAQQLKDSGAEAVILLSSPVVFVLGLAPAAANQSYAPVWIGPGITSGLNAVTAIGCPNVGDGRVLLADAGARRHRRARPRLQRRRTPQYAGGAAADDIGLQLWSLNKALAPDARGDRAGARPGRVHEHARHDAAVRQRHLPAGGVTPSTTTSAARVPTCSRPTATPSSTSPRREFVAAVAVLTMGLLGERRRASLVGVVVAVALVVVLIADGRGRGARHRGHHRFGVRAGRPRARARLQVERRVQLRPGRVRHRRPLRPVPARLRDQLLAGVPRRARRRRADGLR